ncbi:MAG: class I SAM-dependent methyltransferase [Planctomycetota bacterium]|nr:class I SAM-dependent methyltransferase [Planctomycetota bacterium]
MDRDARNKFFESVGDGVILNLGAGERTILTGTEWIGFDIQPHANCEVVGDAHQLPFRDESFDAVHTVSVFEHLRKPWLAAAEIVRVLRPGGFLFCSVPFAYPIHGSPYDFFRYTPDGLLSIFEALEGEVFPARGPISSIGLYTERVADAVFPGKLGFAARWCTAWAIQPLKYLDPWLTKSNPDSATSFTILATKPI